LRWNGSAYKQGCGMRSASGELCLFVHCDLLRFSTASEQDPQKLLTFQGIYHWKKSRKNECAEENER